MSWRSVCATYLDLVQKKGREEMRLRKKDRERKGGGGARRNASRQQFAETRIKVKAEVALI